MDNSDSKALQYAQNLCHEDNSQLLYLVYFGSRLYGTSGPNSDTDLKGIFLPSIESLILGKAKKSLHFSTGNDQNRNSAVDIDIDLWSLQHWLLKLLPAGDTSALDLLFSFTNPSCVLCKSPLLDQIFSSPLKFLDLAHNRAYAEYSISQAKKYGIKGSQLGALRRVANYLQELPDEGRLASHIQDITAYCADGRYCFSKTINDIPCLLLCGKTHVGGTPIAEFKARVKRDMSKYGSRAQEAEQNLGLDYKALSHSLRALDQMEELLKTGVIKYPLASREKLMQVKRGEIPWLELEKIIINRLSEVSNLYERIAPSNVLDLTFVEKFLISCYACAEKEI